MSLSKIKQEDLIFENKCFEDRINTELRLRDNSWMDYQLTTAFNTKKQGRLEVMFEYYGTVDSQMQVEQKLIGKTVKIIYEYPDELSPLNQFLLTPIPITKLTKEQAYRIAYEGLDENDFKTILDEDRMVMDFILEYRARKQNNTPVSIAENTR